MAQVPHNRRRVLVVEPAAVEANVFSAFRSLPLLGPLYLGTILRLAGFEVRIVSENILGRHLRTAELNSDLMLLSCLTSTVERGYELASLFKRANPSGVVIMGGPHVTFMPQEALQHVDHVVTGEGEEVILDLARNGTTDRIVRGRPVGDLDCLPPIDWSLLVLGNRMRIQPLMFSRGCPFACTFCSVTTMFGRQYRTMSVERTLEELFRVTRHSAFIYDDNFAADRERTHRIMDGILARGGLRYGWGVQVRADVTRDEKLVAKMARAGCSRVYVGFETINDRALCEIRKGQTAEDVQHAVRVLHKYGIRVHGMFMFGADADDASVVRMTSDFVHRERIDSVQYSILTPLPGTELYYRMEREGRLLHKLWRYYDGMHVVILPSQFSPHELQQSAVETYSEYYNALQAVKEGWRAVAASLRRSVGAHPAAAGAPSLYNAALRIMGHRIVRHWRALNADYLAYLRSISSSYHPAQCP